MRLREINAGWFDVEECQRTCKVSPWPAKWKYQASGCEACLLSRITGDLEILLDLRWACLSRATRLFVAKRGNPRLQQWLYVWIAVLAEHIEQVTGQQIDHDAIMLENEKEAILLKKVRAVIDAEKHRKRKGEKEQAGQGAWTAEVSQGPYDWSYPIQQAPYQAEPPESPDIPESPEILTDDEDADDAQFQSMAPSEQNQSTYYLPSTIYTPPTFPSASMATMSTVGADRTTKGKSPYQHESPPETTVESLYSADLMLDKRLHIVTEADEDVIHEAAAAATEHQDYIPPRSMWPKPAQPPRPDAAHASSSHLPKAESITNESTPSLTHSIDSWERSTTSVISRSSWETECIAAETFSSIYSCGAKSPAKKAHPPPSQSWYSLSDVAQQTDYTQPRQRRKGAVQAASDVSSERNPAETYTNLLHSSPFSDSNATLRQPREADASRAATEQTQKQVREQSTQLRPSSTSAVRLNNDISPPGNPSTSTTARHHNSSATASRQVDSRTPRAPAPSNSTQHFLQLYDEVISSYMDDDPRSQGELLPRTTYEWRTSSELTPALTSASTLSSESSTTKTATTAAEAGKKPRPTATGNDIGLGVREGQGGVSPAESKVTVASDQTRWSGAYESQIHSRESLGWFYGKSKGKSRVKRGEL
jgi:hypothetical protein